MPTVIAGHDYLQMWNCSFPSALSESETYRLDLRRMTALVINNVQLLRAIAAYCVVFYHAPAFINSLHPNAFRSHLIGIGVDIFFVISGLIMIYTNQQAACSTGTGTWCRRSPWPRPGS